MSVKLRLRRMGGKNDVFYRVVAADARSPRDGRFIEVVGWYDPKQAGRNFKLKMDRIEHWIKEGAEVSDTVNSLIKRDHTEPADATPAEEPIPEKAKEEEPELAAKAEDTTDETDGDAPPEEAPAAAEEAAEAPSA